MIMIDMPLADTTNKKARKQIDTICVQPPNVGRFAPVVKDADARGQRGRAVAVGHGLCQKGASDNNTSANAE